tara:strand:+ start:57 stop:170 length:114 start_codon:yes stop_codon:yes gene_type:complete
MPEGKYEILEIKIKKNLREKKSSIMFTYVKKDAALKH